MADGWITIGTNLDTGKFDQQYKDLEKKMKQEEEKGFTVKAKLDTQQQELIEARKKVDELADAYERLKQIQASPNAFRARYGEYVDIRGKYGKLENIERSFDKALNTQIKLEQQVASTETKYQGIINKVGEFKEKLNRVNLQRQKAEVEQFKSGFSNIGNNIEGVISKIGRLALGVFGIRTALMTVRRASSELASYNPQYSANLEYIRYALTQLIAPVLEYIVNLAKTILAYINYIANAWFGVNLFANASAKSFNQVKKNIGGASASAKELQKTLTGFDEMNILNSTSTGGGGGVGGGIGPDFDLADLDDIVIPEWIKWIANNKNIVIGAIMGIASAFLIFKTLQITGVLKSIGTAITEVISGLGLFNKVLLGLGIATIITGVVMAVSSLIKYVNDPTWENFRGILVGLEVALAGVAATLIALNKSNPVGWIILAADAIAGLITWIGDLINKETEEEKTLRMQKEATERLKKAREDLQSAMDSYINAVDRAEDTEKKLAEAQDETGISIDDLLQKMQDENLTYRELDNNQRKVYKAYVNNKGAQDELKKSTEELSSAKTEENGAMLELAGTLTRSAKNYDEYKEKLVNAYNEGKISAETATQSIIMNLTGVDDKTRESFTKDLPDAIKQGLNPSNYSQATSHFVDWWNNSFLSKVQKKINMQIQAGVSYAGASYVEPIKMASGGLINMPNRGVPLSRAVGGESGVEGLVPLTDQQAMAQLGAEIGRNVVVNLTNITSMNGRTINRELKILQDDRDFAYNS